MSPEEEKRFEFQMLKACQLKILVAKDIHIEDRDLQRQLGISAQQLQEIKTFCKINKMRVNEPLKNKAKKDARLLKKV